MCIKEILERIYWYYDALHRDKSKSLIIRDPETTNAHGVYAGITSTRVSHLLTDDDDIVVIWI